MVVGDDSGVVVCAGRKEGVKVGERLIWGRIVSRVGVDSGYMGTAVVGTVAVLGEQETIKKLVQIARVMAV